MVSKNELRANKYPIDPDVKVPEAVRRAAEAASKAQADAYPGVEPAPPFDPNAPQDPQIKIAEPVPPEVTADLKITPVEAPPAAPPAEAPPDDQSWKAKYESQLGRVSAMRGQNLDMAARITALENMLAGAQAAPRAPEQPVTPAERKRLITPKEEEDFGTEMLDVMRRAAQEVATPEVQVLRESLARLEAKIGGTEATLVQGARERMHNDLQAALPDWQAINHLPEFHAWLALPDAFSGVMRKSLLTAAYEQNKTPQVLAFFKSFVSELAATQPAGAQEEQPPAVNTQPVKPSLASLAAPGRARTSASVSLPDEKQTIYTSDVNAFYAAKRKGLYNGREAEFAQHEAELQRAMREGRVVTNT